VTRLIALVALSIPSAASAATVYNAGDFTLSLGFGLGDVAGLGEVEFTGYMNGSIDEVGEIFIHRVAVRLDDAALETADLGDVTFSPNAASHWSGSLDPETGEMGLHGMLSIGVSSADYLLGPRCEIGPIELRLNTGASGEIEGELYDSESGRVVLADGAFDVPISSGCRDLSGVSFDETVVLPAESGRSWLAMEVHLEDESGAPLRSEDWLGEGDTGDTGDPGFDTGAPPDGHEPGAGGGEVGGEASYDTGPPPLGHEPGAGGGDTSDPGYDTGAPPHGDEPGAGGDDGDTSDPGYDTGPPPHGDEPGAGGDDDTGGGGGDGGGPGGGGPGGGGGFGGGLGG